MAHSYDPAQPQFRVGRKVIKGGSHLCADSYCRRYRPAARRPQMIDTGMSHIEFRCVWSTTSPVTPHPTYKRRFKITEPAKDAPSPYWP